MSRKNRSARWANAKHRWLALIGGIAMLLWGISGLAHVAMVLFGPQQAQFMPPGVQLELAGARPLAETLKANGIGEALAVKTVAAPDGAALWQVTETARKPARYFRPLDGVEVAQGDRKQAEFLARHFLATRAPIKTMAFQSEFSADYPWVNRLLPVWRIEFAGEEPLTAFVHTETSSLAAVNNPFKAGLQTLFRALHTWEWVPEGMDWLRVVVIGLMVGSLFALGATGIIMLVTVRRKKRAPGSRGWHRIMSYVLALPLLMFSASGIYHLVQAALVPPGSNLAMGEPVDVAAGGWAIEEDWAALTDEFNIASVALVTGSEGQPLYRLGLAQAAGAMGGGMHDHGAGESAAPTGMVDHADHSDHVAHAGMAETAAPETDGEIREARFLGIKPEGPALYVDAASGTVAPDSDRAIALQIARRFTGAPDDTVTNAKMITRFSHEYDFRNKRLPVWRVDYGDPVSASLFVDPAAGVLVDRVEDWEKAERFSFSMIHKWNFLFPIGRVALNVVVAAFVVALIGFMAVLGLKMDFDRRRRQRAASSSKTM